MRRLTILSRLLLLTLLTLVPWQTPSTTMAQTQGQPADGWVSLASSGVSIRVLGVPDQWPADPFIYVAGEALPTAGSRRQQEAPAQVPYRSLDGGRTWELIPPAPQTTQTDTVRP